MRGGRAGAVSWEPFGLCRLVSGPWPQVDAFCVFCVLFWWLAIRPRLRACLEGKTKNAGLLATA